MIPYGGEGSILPDVTDGYIVKDGETEYVVVVSEEESDDITLAAKELYDLFLEATGIELQFVNDSNATYSENAKYISLGNTQISKVLGKDVETLGEQGFILKTEGQSIFILGKPQGVLYGVYEFLNKTLNFETYTKDVYTLNKGVTELGCQNFDDEQIPDIEYSDDKVKFCLIGRPNVGKSSLVNAILNEDKAIVSDVAGTTRDAVDTELRYNGEEYVVIDTAGMRKRGKIYENIEKYSVLRSMKAIERANVCVLVINAEEGIIEHDKHIASYALEAGKPMVIVVNKWDTVKDTTIKKELPLLMLITLAFATTLLEGITSPGTTNIFSRSRGVLFISLFSLVFSIVYFLSYLFYINYVLFFLFCI